jgi:aspartate/methionine/tyrosine aminotransferase
MTKFLANGIISLLDENLTYNLAESTAENLQLGDIFSPQLQDTLKYLHLGYGSSRGNQELRCEIASRLEVSPDSVLITNGAAASLFLSVFVLCEPSDEVVTVSPNFPPTLDVISALGVRCRTVRLLFEEQYRLSFARLEQELLPQTKLVILVTPHNPSGVTLSLGEIEQVLKLMAVHCPNAYLLIDETYREATYGNNLLPASAANLSDRVVTASSISKCHGAPGLRIGWLTCKSPEILEQLTFAKMNTVISCSVVDEILGLEVLRHSPMILHDRQVMLASAVRKVAEWIGRHEDYVEWVPPQGGALCCVRLRPDLYDESRVKDFYRKARSYELQVADGAWFGESSRVFRLGFGFLPLPQLECALDALSRTLKEVLDER